MIFINRLMQHEMRHPKQRILFDDYFNLRFQLHSKKSLLFKTFIEMKWITRHCLGQVFPQNSPTAANFQVTCFPGVACVPLHNRTIP